MKRLFALLIGLTLAACASLPLPGNTPTIDGSVVARAQQGAPRLQVGIVSQRASTLIIQQTVRNGFETFASVDGANITMLRGIMVSTRGLGGDMLGSDVTETVQAVLGQTPGRVTRFHTFLDGENRAERRAYICDVEARGPRDVAFGDTTITAQLMAEDCASQNQTFLNLYWIDRNGKIIQSRQWAGGFAGILTFRIVP